MAKSEDIMERLEALEAKMARFMLQSEESPIALLYPEPIATPLAKENAAFRYHEKFFNMIDAGEACIKFTTSLALALISHENQDIKINEYFTQPLTLGGWAKLLRDIMVNVTIPGDGIAVDLKSSLTRSNGRPTQAARYLFAEFINLRNEYRGHTSALTEEVYKRLHLQHSGTLHDTFNSLTFLKYPLVRVESVIMETHGFSYDVRILVGPAPIGRIVRIYSENRINAGTTCLWDESNQELIYFRKTVIHCSCPECNLEHTFFLERSTPEYFLYHSYSGNHRFRKETDRE